MDRARAHEDRAGGDLVAIRESHADRAAPVEQDAIHQRIAAHRQVGPLACGFEVRVVRRNAVAVAQRERGATEPGRVGSVVVVAGRVAEIDDRGRGTRRRAEATHRPARGRAGSVRRARAVHRRRSRRRPRRVRNAVEHLGPTPTRAAEVGRPPLVVVASCLGSRTVALTDDEPPAPRPRTYSDGCCPAARVATRSGHNRPGSINASKKFGDRTPTGPPPAR